ncbi:MAG: helix-turn-helix domain-containing protein [Rikenellaceae bacterium]
MDVITIDSEAFKRLEDNISNIHDYIKRLEEENRHLTIESLVIDNYDLCTYLRTTTKTLWRKRDEGKLAFIDDGGRIRYRVEDIRRFLDIHSFKGCQVTIDDVIECHLNYVKQRQNTKFDQ